MLGRLKGIVTTAIILAAMLILSSCTVQDNIPLQKNFSGDFTAVYRGDDYSGKVVFSEKLAKIIFSLPSEISGITFTLNRQSNITDKVGIFCDDLSIESDDYSDSSFFVVLTEITNNGGLLKKTDNVEIYKYFGTYKGHKYTVFADENGRAVEIDAEDYDLCVNFKNIK